jgi:hypothetical protein
MSLDNAPAANASTPAAPAAPALQPNWDAFAGGADMNSAPPAPQSQPPAPTPTSPAPTPAAPPVEDWRGRYAARGLDVANYQSEDDLYQDLAAYQRERPQLQQYAQIGAQLAPHAQRFAEFVAAQQQQQQPAAPQADEPDPLEQAWGAPPYDPTWASQVKVDENGDVVPLHALVPFSVVEGYKKYHEHQRQKAVEFFNNPYKQTFQALEPKLKQAIRAEFEQLQQQNRQQQTLQQFEQQNATWLYQADNSGRPLIHPATNQPVLSPLGQRFAEHVQILRSAGATDPTAIAMLAANNVRAEMAIFSQQVQQQPQHTQPRAPNGQFISPAAAQPTNLPPASPEQTNQNRIGSFLANAHQNAAFATPSFNGAPDPTNGNWAVRSERELDHRLAAALDRAAGIQN